MHTCTLQDDPLSPEKWHLWCGREWWGKRLSACLYSPIISSLLCHVHTLRLYCHYCPRTYSPTDYFFYFTSISRCCRTSNELLTWWVYVEVAHLGHCISRRGLSCVCWSLVDRSALACTLASRCSACTRPLQSLMLTSQKQFWETISCDEKQFREIKMEWGHTLSLPGASYWHAVFWLSIQQHSQCEWRAAKANNY